MKALSDFRLCANCGTRNKPKWEFCIKCGESLEGLTLVSGPPAAAAPGGPEAAEAPEGEPLTAGLGSTFAVLGAALVLAGLAYYISSNPNKADASIFAGPTLPAAPPVAPPPVGPETDLQQGRRLLLQGDPGALQRLAQAVADSPQDAGAHYAYAQALWQSGQQDEALSQYAAAAQFETKGASKYHYDYAKALAALGRKDDAIREYGDILAAHPDSPGALRDLAALHLAAGRPAQAAELLSRAAELAPARAGLNEVLGHALEKAGEPQKAIEAYRRELELNADAQSTRSLLADALYRQNQAEDAIALLRQGLDRRPDAAALHRELGSILDRAGRPAEAAAEYREYIRLAPAAVDAQALGDRAARLEQAAAPAPPTS